MQHAVRLHEQEIVDEGAVLLHRLRADVVAVVEGDGAALLQRPQRRHVPAHGADRSALVLVRIGGALVPLMCVDKTPQELASFDALVQEAQQFTAPGHDWAMVFAAAMSGRG